MVNAKKALDIYKKLRGDKLTDKDCRDLGDLARFSTRVVLELGEFFLLNEKGPEFDKICGEMKRLLGYFDSRKHLFEDWEWYQELPVRWTVFAELTGKMRETPNKASELVVKVEAIQKAEDISEARGCVEYFRNSFHRIGQYCGAVVEAEREKQRTGSLYVIP